jgi:hypothetical protein
VDLIPPITLYGDLPGPDSTAFGDPVWLNGDGQCFVWRTDTVPPQPLSLGIEGCGSPVRPLGSPGAPLPPAGLDATPTWVPAGSTPSTPSTPAGSSTTPPKTTAPTTPGPLSSAGRVGSPVVWLGLAALGAAILFGRRS